VLSGREAAKSTVSKAAGIIVFRSGLVESSRAENLGLLLFIAGF
jgi:hypothetical protein